MDKPLDRWTDKQPDSAQVEHWRRVKAFLEEIGCGAQANDAACLIFAGRIIEAMGGLRDK